MKKALRFEAVEVGDELPALRVVLTNAQVRAYAVAADMPGGRFMSDDAARAEGLPGQIIPGNLSMALFSRLLGEWGEGVRVKRLSATFRGLVFPNAPLLVTAVVTEKHTSDHGSFVECDLVLETEDGERKVTGTATVELPSGA
jgi:acyl dehydratase